MTTARQRRSPAEVRAEILQAATETFTARGYAGTSTRGIAETARVAEPLIFRHFGSKAELFSAAAFASFTSFVAAFVAGYEESLAVRHEGLSAADYMGGLFDELRANKTMIRMLLAASLVDPEFDRASTSANTILQAAFARLEELVVIAVEARGEDIAQIDAPLAVRCAFGMALSMAVLDDLVLPPDHDRPGRDDIVHELSLNLQHGFWGRFGSGQTQAAARGRSQRDKRR